MGMITLSNYSCGEWKSGRGAERVLHHAVTGEKIATCASEGLDFARMLEWGRTRGGPTLRAMTFPERAALLKTMAARLNDHVDEFHRIASTYGATRHDATLDIEGGIGTLGFFGSLGAKKLPASTFLTDGEAIQLSKPGNFVGRHIYVPLEGVAVQVNAYNFPAWGMLEKLAPSMLAGMPSIVKPATPTAWLTFRMVEILIESGVMPEGTLQLICGSVGDLLDHLTCQDVISFTGSASTGEKIRSHPNVVRNAVRVNIEADSLNGIVLGPDVAPGSPDLEHFTEEIFKEMTIKAGQKCTAIRRVLVPEDKERAVLDALTEKLKTVRVGDPELEGVNMGPLVDRAALESARRGIEELNRETEVVSGNPQRTRFEGEGTERGFFMEPILLRATNVEESRSIHEIEIFGPVATILAYRDVDQALRLVRRGGGSLVATVYSEDESFIREMAFGLAPYHGRLMVMNAKAAPESTGHGVVMPHLVHGGPGRAGGGEELGGARSLHRYMQRIALQGEPARLERLCAPATAE
jgi:oxepin-CoA hydrolase/3-oxo-5,6-dehydrosuberyl-CoA semialdehyde dehydrogenase